MDKRTELRESAAQVAYIALGIASIWAIHASLLGEH